MWAVLQGSLLVFHTTPVLKGELVDPDAYMRLVRVAELYHTGDWYDGTISRSNIPYGETLHWTRPFDMLLILGAALLAPFVGFEDGLFWFGAFVSPLLQLLTGFLFLWASAPLVGRDRGVVAVVILFLQPAVLAYCTPARADHHALLFLVFLAIFGYTLRVLTRRDDLRSALLGGAAAGFGLWLSVELLAGVAACLAGIMLAWVVAGGERARQGLVFATSLSAVVALGLFAERPLGRVFAASYDRISSVHLAVAGIALAGFLATTLAPRVTFGVRSPAGRLILAGLGALLGAAALYLLFPKFFLGPMVEVDPRIVPIWLDKVTEMKSVLPTTTKDVGRFIYYFGAGILSVPFLLWLLWNERERPQWSGWCCIGIGIAILFPAAVAHVRFAPFVEILFVFVLAGLLDRLFTWTSRFPRELPRAAVRVSALTLSFVGSLGVGTVVMAAGGEPRDAATGGRCSMREIATYLNDPAYWPDTHAIAALVDYGPELLYRTRHAVVGTPYHRNGDGILDTYLVLTGDDDRVIKRLLRGRGIDLILLCPSRAESAFFSSPAGEGSLYRRLLNGRVPDWVERVDLPRDLDDTYHLYVLDHRLD